MSDASPVKRKSNTKRLLLAIPLLLLVAIAVNWPSIMSVARGEKSLRGVIYGITNEGAQELAGWTMPDDVGPEDAAVTIEAFMREGDPCHVEMLFMGRALATLDPERIRTVFVNTATPEGAKRYSELKLGCEQGLAVNGETKFKVEQPNDEKTFYLTLDGGWQLSDLLKIIDKDLKKAHDGQGLKMSIAEAEEQIKAESARARELATAEVGARREAEKGK